MKQVTIHTDGACEGNPGPGGWAAVLQYETQLKEITGSEAATTNNRMELQAAIGALGALKEPCEVNLYTDSQYLRQGVTEWLKVWRNKGWKTSTKEPVKNQDLWQQLDRLTGIHKVHWHWVRGHAGHSLNEKCDQLAVGAIAALKKRMTSAELKKSLAEFKANPPGQPKTEAKLF